MASVGSAALCVVVGLLYWTLLGYPIAQRLLGRPLALPVAPLLGWALHSVAALLVFFVVPLSAVSILTVAVLCLLLVFAALKAETAFFGLSAGRDHLRGGTPDRPMRPIGRGSSAATDSAPAVPVLALFMAALLAVAVAAAIAPKYSGAAVVLSDEIFDHAKVAIVDEIARLGVPPGNPFFAHDGGSGKLAYYYLWHFSAAELSRLLGVSGWNADLAMTFFSALTSLSVMMALAVRLSRRTSAGYWVVLLALGSSARPLIQKLVGVASLAYWLPTPGGFGGWLFQSSWVPQHLISCSCVSMSVYLMVELTARANVLTVVVLAFLIAAGFEASTWVGGVTFAVATLCVVPILLVRLERPRQPPVAIALLVAGILSILIAWPFLTAQAAAALERQTQFPIALRAFTVLGEGFREPWQSALNLPAFWFALLPLEFSASFVLAVAFLLRGRKWIDPDEMVHRLSLAMVSLAAMALLVAGSLASTLAQNNDLSWRAGLLGSTTLIILAAIGASLVWDRRQWLPIGVLATLLATGAPETYRELQLNIVGEAEPDGAAFARSAQMWQSVRRYTEPAERVANNPLAFQDMTPWPVNISWGLLADRRSCYPGWELAQVYTSLPHDRLYLVDLLFKRVFSGAADPGDIQQLSRAYGCDTAVVTPEDGAWSHDPFRDSSFYHLVEENAGHWRIYRRSDLAQPRPPNEAPKILE